MKKDSESLTNFFDRLASDLDISKDDPTPRLDVSILKPAQPLLDMLEEELSELESLVETQKLTSDGAIYYEERIPELVESIVEKCTDPKAWEEAKAEGIDTILELPAGQLVNKFYFEDEYLLMLDLLNLVRYEY